MRIAIPLLLSILLLSACAAPASQPAPTPLTEQTIPSGQPSAPVSQPTTTPPPSSSVPQPDLRPSIDIAEIPEKVSVGQTVRIAWNVNANRPATASHVAIHYDSASHPGTFGDTISPQLAGYAQTSQIFVDQPIAKSFSTILAVETPGKLFVRAHAIVQGKNYWTKEYVIDVQGAQPAAIRTAQLIVEADDNGIYPNELSVVKGTEVTITFRVRQQGTYYGGLEFRSGKFATGKIPPGGEKTVTFTADSDVPFTSYWPASNVRKASGIVRVR